MDGLQRGEIRGFGLHVLYERLEERIYIIAWLLWSRNNTG
jgi:hypothetical protein